MTSSRDITQIDKQLTARIAEYMQFENETDCQNPDEIAASLREDHPREYARRKMSDFKNIVGKIFAELKSRKENGNGVNGSEVSEDDQPPTPAKAGEAGDSDDSDLCIVDDSSTPAPPPGHAAAQQEAMREQQARQAQIRQWEQMQAMTQQRDMLRAHLEVNSTTNGVNQPSNAFPPSGNTSSLDDARTNNIPRGVRGGRGRPNGQPRKRSKWDQKVDQNDDSGPSNKKKAKQRRRRSRSSSSSSSGSDDDRNPRTADFSVIGQKSHISLANDVVLPDKTRSHLEKILETLAHLELFQHLNVEAPRGILLHGPAGCGKTMLAKALANYLDTHYFYISATELTAGVPGTAEKRIRGIFQKAAKPMLIDLEDEGGPVTRNIIIFDEFDVIASDTRSSTTNAMNRRIISQLCASLDGNDKILVVACTSRPEQLDPVLRRAGRFDHEFILPIPSEQSRGDMLKKMCAKVKISDCVDFEMVARLTPGYVGSDLQMLLREAAQFAVANRLAKPPSTENDKDPPETPTAVNEKPSETMVDDDAYDPTAVVTSKPESSQPEEPLYESLPDPLKGFQITQTCFLEAMRLVTPASKREGFACVPDVTWDDIGALDNVREELRLAIVAPVRYPEIFTKFGQSKPPGVLLAGPPGNGKTLLAKAVANESGLNFIAVNGPELLNMYVGESERAVRSVFTRGRHSSPCVIFFDEIDALCPKRQTGSGGGSEHSSRLVNQMLTEMDGISSSSTGLEATERLFIMAATNRPDMLDPALTRPGRLDKTLYVGLPAETGRESILQAQTRSKPKIAPSVDLAKLCKDSRFDNLSGADIAAVVREAAMHAMRVELEKCLASNEHKMATKDDSQIDVNSELTMENFDAALDRIRPSISSKDRASYGKLERELSK